MVQSLIFDEIRVTNFTNLQFCFSWIFKILREKNEQLFVTLSIPGAMWGSAQNLDPKQSTHIFIDVIFQGLRKAVFDIICCGCLYSEGENKSSKCTKKDCQDLTSFPIMKIFLIYNGTFKHVSSSVPWSMIASFFIMKREELWLFSSLSLLHKSAIYF